MPPESNATTGFPAIIASIPTRPNGSGHIDGTATIDAVR